jgi:hypothetical protein
MPGDGDVSPMDPTIAYGAAPNMLVFAPDGGAGFDLVGQDSYVEFLTSWNTTIAGPLGTSGAQNVIPPIPKGPMAVRATPWGRNGGVFDHRLLHKCNNSTSGTRAATEVTDAWVKPENCATNTGLNNRHGLTTSQRTQGSELLTRVLYDAARGHKAQACYHNLDLEHWRPEAAQ